MDNKKQMELLINSIKLSNPKLRTEDISVKAGYKEQTLTQAISSGNVSDRMLYAVMKEFPNDNEGFSDIKNPVIVGNTHGVGLEGSIRTEALLRSIAPYVADIYAFLVKVPATKVLKDMEQVEVAEKTRLVNELKKR